MPKPRTGWKGLGTTFKHLGTIIAHPQQYYRYKKHRDAFVQENHLPLHPHYHGERDNPGHPYPGARGATVRERGVIYPGRRRPSRSSPDCRAGTGCRPAAV